MATKIQADFGQCNAWTRRFEEVAGGTGEVKTEGNLYTGVDLGTAFVVLTVLNEAGEPVAGGYRFATVVKDGLVVDFLGAIRIVSELKAEVEHRLGRKLHYAATAIPPGTSLRDSGSIRHVVEGAGFEVTGLFDEPTAANAVLGIRNGAVVDVGGGTTGIAIMKDGQVVYTADEPTGGTHFSLVVAGAMGISVEEAELRKRNPENHGELLPVLKPVVQKVASIINQHIAGHTVDALYLVGGTCCLAGMEHIITTETGIQAYKPENPMFVTPLGIARCCARGSQQ